MIDSAIGDAKIVAGGMVACLGVGLLGAWCFTDLRVLVVVVWERCLEARLLVLVVSGPPDFLVGFRGRLLRRTPVASLAMFSSV